MTSEKQLAANRENAKHCTGPNTPNGKATSSQNALKSGLYSEREVLPFEEESEYHELKADFYDRYQPAVPEERTLVELLIKCEWLQRRYMFVETGIWQYEFCQTTHHTIGVAYRKHTEELDRVARSRSRAQRDFQNALKQLMDLRAKRTKEEAAERSARASRPVESHATLNQSLSPQLVSFRQNAPATPEPPSEAAAVPAQSTPNRKKEEDQPPVAA